MFYFCNDAHFLYFCDDMETCFFTFFYNTFTFCSDTLILLLLQLLSFLYFCSDIYSSLCFCGNMNACFSMSTMIHTLLVANFSNSVAIHALVSLRRLPCCWFFFAFVGIHAFIYLHLR